MLDKLLASKAAVGTSRRQLLARAGIAGAAVAGAGLVGSTSKRNVASAATLETTFTAPDRRFKITDVDILNFALNLEYLEAEFYQRAVFGVGLDSSLTSTGLGDPGGVVGGNNAVTFTDAGIQAYAQEIATDELNHVKFLKSALGSLAVREPQINFTDAFTNAAIAAGVIQSGQTFDPFADQTSFLLGAFVFEDVGVTAYHGASPYVKNPTYLNAAAGILGVEAYHGGTVRLLLAQAANGDSSSTVATIANAITTLRNTASAAADGVNPTEQPLFDSNGTPILVPTDSNSIAYARSFQAVLNIVYLGGASGAFGFFPNRMNGRIN